MNARAVSNEYEEDYATTAGAKPLARIRPARLFAPELSG